MTTTPAPPAPAQADIDRVLERAVADISGAYGGALIILGDALGLYEAMAGRGPMTARELAEGSGCAERYVREWLNAQAAGGYVAYHPAGEAYELTEAQRAVLADRESPFFMPHAWKVPLSMFADLEMAETAFLTGNGVPWGAHDERLYDGVASFYRNGYEASLVQEWIPALSGVEERLLAGARVADIGCGHGHSTVIMARAYPRSRFWGVDAHAPSIEAARAGAREAGVEDRVTFVQADAAAHDLRDLDLACFFDCFHDLGDPRAAAEAVAAALNPGGSMMLVEPAAGDRVEDNLNPVGRLYYAASTTLCCAHAVSEGAGDPLGAQAGEARLAEICRRAGLPDVHRVAESPFNIVLQARVHAPE